MYWEEVTLGDILNFRRGHDLPKADMMEGNIPVAGSNGIIGYHNQCSPISPILTVGRSGNVGTPYIYEKAWAHNTTLYVDDFKGNYPLFLYYLIKTLPLSNFGGGSAVPTLNRNHIHPLKVKYPPKYCDQKRIADILSSLDAKIENNNKINAKLEEMAQALFKSWFIDFEPFKDGNFVESELGMIPEGWKVKALGDCTRLITKGTTPTSLKKEFKESGIVFVKAESIKDDHSLDFQKVSFIDEETNILLKRSIICPNDILFTIAGTLGRFCLVESELSVANTNQAVAIIRLNENCLPSKVFFSYLLGNWHKDYCIRNIQQAVQANLSLKTISCMPILVPDSETLRKYTCVIEPIISKMKELEIENRNLAQTRDTLLPKLMSGEIEL